MNIKSGVALPGVDGYADQPKIVVADDDTWVYVVTLSMSTEGNDSTFIGTSYSKDEGKTWSSLQRIEESTRESSYASLYKAPYGRIFCFYNFNEDGIKKTEPIIESDGTISYINRCDEGLGVFCFKYSDDNGKSWSEKYYPIPIRDFEIDVENITKVRGKQRRYFWNVSNPFEYENVFYQTITKIQFYHGNADLKTEGVLICSKNLCYERDPEKITWETLPDGDVGIRHPINRNVSEEHCCLPLSDGTFYDVFRNDSGYVGMSISRDKGHSWSEAEPMKFFDGSIVKTPRANAPIWKCENGRYLLWFHNHDFCVYGQRNPVWLSAGEEIDTANGKTIRWNKPVILMYSEKPGDNISYPDLFEFKGKYYVVETQKTIPRLHLIPDDYMRELWEKPYK